MCGGVEKLSRGPEASEGHAAMDGAGMCKAKKLQGSVLLEMAAADDLPSFRRAVEEAGLDVDLPSPWYGRWGRRMAFEERTPLMIAAMYGSSAVMEYILSTCAADVNRACGTDRFTALHCAASGGAPSSIDAANLLIAASADVEAVNAAGKKPGDLISRKFFPGGSSKLRSLELLLKAAAHGGSGAASPPRKDYPADLTLPDIKSGIYGTDEFRMYSFKVKPCSRAYSHDWTECPFVHPGENARRRDPRKYHYSCVPCPEFRKGSCRNGDACEYAHGVFECWLHPGQYRTRLCKDETGCTRRVCFFAHKPEELRSPAAAHCGAGSPGLPPLDIAAPGSLMLNQQQQQQQQQQPMSPTAVSSAMAAVWMNQGGGMLTPTRQLPSSRLKTSLNARETEIDMELLGLEGYQKKIIEEMAGLSSPSSWKSSLAEEYDSPALLSHLQGLSLRQSAAAAAAGSAASHFQTLSGIGMTQQLYSQQPLRASPPSSSFGLDHSLAAAAAAAAVMNSRSSAFAKRSQSFCDRGAVSRLSGMAAATTAPPPLSGWASPDGKLDWGVHGDELNKLRKSASFGFRGNGVVRPESTLSAAVDEPDVSWVQSLVKDAPPVSGGLRIGSFDEFRPSEAFSPWADQLLYMEQEQMVA
ncbi:unnamed protein product [Spirodela intermedia]|uniref:C3H1-type domain-containing protein n=1 Tax=Spirodela intermedia TaxID=51605 RepID=A0A7I8K607_SPIIN|nr:unnamed protein product [Spirodela intermedia]